MQFSDDQIEKIRAEILAICGPEKYNSLVRQHSETIERGKLRFWQQELFDNYLQQAAMTIDSMALYIQAFQDAEPVAVPEKPFVYPDAPKDALSFAVARSDLTKIQECFRLGPNAVEILAADKLPTWIVCEAGKHASPETVRLLAELGCDLNQSDSNDFTGLGWAVANDRYEVARTFLELGADANKGLPLFNLFSDIANPVSMARLLIENGADPHQSKWIDESPVDLLSRSLARGQIELANYFRSLGVRPLESNAGLKPSSPRENVLDCFREHFGEVAKGSIEHIVSPADTSPISIHYIPIDLESARSILFTAGLSTLTVDRVELILALPLNWPTLSNAIKSEATAWPIQWMFKIASYLTETSRSKNQDWMVVANEIPPRPLASGVPFTCWALCDGKVPFIVNQLGDPIRILEMYPLYPQESELTCKPNTWSSQNFWLPSPLRYEGERGWGRGA